MMWRWQRRALEEAWRREFRLLHTEPEPFPGIVWGCARWRRCADRIVETPPYGPRLDPGRCRDHRLPMTTKIVQSRTVGDPR